jgi:hypothetical protein
MGRNDGIIFRVPILIYSGFFQNFISTERTRFKHFCRHVETLVNRASRQEIGAVIFSRYLCQLADTTRCEIDRRLQHGVDVGGGGGEQFDAIRAHFKAVNLQTQR